MAFPSGDQVDSAVLDDRDAFMRYVVKCDELRKQVSGWATYLIKSCELRQAAAW